MYLEACVTSELWSINWLLLSGRWLLSIIHGYWSINWLLLSGHWLLSIIHGYFEIPTLV